ncbi:rap1 GTPase-activating protein 2-like, partial [Malurus melanocephalus]|uniref:rap1 GTPase-activating protein 2-like n=1 Tax=Malurus melanocephalus TaxID=175006 RepID=UPI002549B487
SQPPVPAAAAKNQSRSPIKRRSGLFPRLHTTSESQESRTRCDSVSGAQKTPDMGHSSQEMKSETSSNPSSPEICPNKDRPFLKLKENGRWSNMSRSSSSTSSFSSTAGESEALEEYDSVVSTKHTLRIIVRVPQLLLPLHRWWLWGHSLQPPGGQRD